MGLNDTYGPRNPAWLRKSRACADLGATRSTAVFRASDESYEGRGRRCVGSLGGAQRRGPRIAVGS